MASSTADLGRMNRARHRIDTGTVQPIRQSVRHISPIHREEVKALLDQMLERGVVEPSSSPWASPIVLVCKKDGSSRFCIDYRKLNHVTQKDAYPLPRIDVTLDTLHGSRWFTIPLTCSVATGRLRWKRPIRRRQPFALLRGSTSSVSCPLGFVTPWPLSKGSWTLCCPGCSGPSVWCTLMTSLCWDAPSKNTFRTWTLCFGDYGKPASG